MAYMVRAADGRPVDLCENLPRAFTRSLVATAAARIGAVTTVVAVEKKSRERVVGTFQRVSANEIWCVTPMFPQGTIMEVDHDVRGVPVHRFGNQPASAAVTDLRALLGAAQATPASY